MSSAGKTIKIVKRSERETLPYDHVKDQSKAKRQSTREMVKVVTSWIEERKDAARQTSFLPLPLQQTVPEQVA